MKQVNLSIKRLYYFHIFIVSYNNSLIKVMAGLNLLHQDPKGQDKEQTDDGTKPVQLKHFILGKTEIWNVGNNSALQRNAVYN